MPPGPARHEHDASLALSGGLFFLGCAMGLMLSRARVRACLSGNVLEEHAPAGLPVSPGTIDRASFEPGDAVHSPDPPRDS
jgi:hypothetical protein